MSHPTDGHLCAYAFGSIPSGMGLLVASHLTFCPTCRDKTARLETIGGAFLAEDAPADVPPPLLAAPSLFARPGTNRQPACRAEDDPVLPRPLRAAVGRGSRDIRWRRLLPGVAHCPLAVEGGEDVRLIRARPGARLLHHGHEGCEATLVLAGCLRDGPTSFRRGAVSICGQEHEHRPEIVGPEDCICLIVLEGRMRFTGPVGRILNLLSG